MPIGANISVVAIGAILTFATDFDTPGFSVPALGGILMVVGAAGLIMKLMAIYHQRALSVRRAEPLQTPLRQVVVPPVTAQPGRLRRSGTTARRSVRWTRRGGVV